MLWHRTAQRLRVFSPALQGQNKLQPNNSQELSLTDFEGSRFDRWLRQGSGQHPLTGSPQHQWGFLVNGKPGNRLTACCSGALAVLCGCGPVRLSCPGHTYHQGRHQGRCLCSADAGAGASAVCISRVCRRSICWSFMASWAWSVSNRLAAACASAGASARASAPPISTLHRPSCLCAPSAPALIRLCTVSAEIPRCVAVSH